MKVNIKNIKGEDTGKSVELLDDIYAVEPSDHAIYLDVKQYLANQRQGTHKSKERAEIAGSTKKIKRQKGTGTARAGSMKSPIFRGGGRVFGPRPRDYGFKLNKKLKKLARKSALTYKAKDEKVTIVESFDIDTPKTKSFLNILSSLAVQQEKSLLVVDNVKTNVYLSSRNIANTKVVTVEKLNTYEIMSASHLIISEGAVEKIESMFNSKVTA
ncbi:large subunit ribosomal protein L4 [Catalinimonas alkaloidigena]|uniref:50S ribosomal protein L4 n=1 Tax=Catalinimonas alkaloidigena TaxID=1075417 RepID=UPI0024072A15|nr:50S ribosomal protein L4 [Catalinimonas alkaloidigena]MDF9795547.1 large subunit ribosomal protein L4 [Catalinimonas alkaloidigena]